LFDLFFQKYEKILNEVHSQIHEFFNKKEIEVKLNSDLSRIFEEFSSNNYIFYLGI